MTTTTDRKQATEALLADHGQGHLLTWFDQLDDAGQAKLLDQVDAINWDRIDGLIDQYVKQKPLFELPDDVEPASYYPKQPTTELEGKYAEARALGEQMLRDGKVAAFVVAGGSGTRLGWPGPKGTYPGTPIREKTLFHVFAEYLLKVGEKYGVTPPWYVMTSPANDADTRAAFEQNHYFGLSADGVMFFQQGTMPSIAYDGRLFMSDKDSMVLNADGHGGSLKALYRSGAIADMQRRGVEQISYFQVDNPNVKCVDPLFVGLHAIDGAQMSSKMLPKVEPKEKLGNFCLIDGKMTVVEYSDLPDELAEQRLEDGSLRFLAGSIAIHVIAVDFVEQLNAGGDLNLPFHRADKKVPHLDFETGQPVEPAEPNGVKLEQFVFDALPFGERSIVLETDRVEEFAPIKNAEGVDSAVSSKRLQTERAARWLEMAGVSVPRKADGSVDAVIELSHLTAIEPDDLQAADLPASIAPGSEIAL